MWRNIYWKIYMGMYLHSAFARCLVMKWEAFVFASLSCELSFIKEDKKHQVSIVINIIVTVFCKSIEFSLVEIGRNKPYVLMTFYWLTRSCDNVNDFSLVETNQWQCKPHFIHISNVGWKQNEFDFSWYSFVNLRNVIKYFLVPCSVTCYRPPATTISSYSTYTLSPDKKTTAEKD